MQQLLVIRKPVTAPNSLVMLFVGIVFSAVTMFLGIITKLPQGGGGLANNLMVLTLFLQAPPISPPPAPKRTPLDLETAFFENQIFYMQNPVVAGNGTKVHIGQPRENLSSFAGSSNATADNGPFAFPTFASPAFSLPPQLTQFWGSIATAFARIAMVFSALCLPWLVAKYMHLLGKVEASTSISVGFGGLMAQIEPRNPLLENLRLIILERDQALAELRSLSTKAREADKKAVEKDSKMEETLRELRAERDNALAELENEKKKGKKLEEENKREVDGLKEETESQLKAWQENKKKWEDVMAEDRKRHVEAINILKMDREREEESWKGEVEGLELEKKGIEEAFEAKLKNILERMKKEREAWEKENEGWKEEKEVGIAVKEKMAREKEDLEEKMEKEKKASEEATKRAQMRIVELEEHNKVLKDEMAKRHEAKGKEVEAAVKAAVGEEKERSTKEEAQLQQETNQIVAKLEGEVLNGRKLIGDLQADKRRDRQLLLELRAQLVRQTHAAPPTPNYINPLRFGGGGIISAQPFVGQSANLIAAGPSSAFPTTTPRPPNPPTAIPTPIVKLPSSSSSQPPLRAIQLSSPRPTPTVCLPPPPGPRPQPTRAQPPAPTSPPFNAPKGPKGRPPHRQNPI